MKKRIVAIVLSIVFMFTMLPFNVFAEESEIMNSLISTIEEQTGTDIEVATGSDKVVSEPEPSEIEGTSEETIPSEGPETVDSETVSEPAEEEKQEEVSEPKTQTDEIPESESGTKGGDSDPVIPVESISLNITEKEVIAGESFTITATVLPEDATDKTIIWTSSNEEIATVNNGTVTALSEGNATITAASSDGSVSVFCNVNVIASETTYDIAWEINDGVLTISGTGPMEDYASASDSPWYSRRSEVTKVVISEGITHIGARAFFNFTNTIEFEIGEDIESVGDRAFQNCNSIIEIVLPNTLSFIGNYSFFECTCVFTFKGNAPIMSISSIPEQSTIYYYEDKTGYDDPQFNAYEMIQLHCITEWNIESEPNCTESGTRYGYCSYCQKNIYEELPAVGHHFIDGVCDVCGTIQIIQEGECGPTQHFVLYGSGLLDISGTGTMTEAPWRQYDDIIQEVHISEGITNIRSYAFSGCFSLTTVVIPDSVTDIGNGSFNQCEGLSSIVLPDSVTSIGDNAFYGCSSLKSVEIPNGISVIKEKTFSNCRQLEEVYIPDTVKSIGSMAFARTGLVKVSLPNGLTSIANHVFYDCSQLKMIWIPNSVNSIGENTFTGCSSELVILFESESSPSGSWSYYSSIPAIHFGVSYSCAHYWLELSDDIESLTIPEYISLIPAFAFYNNSTLVSINISNSVEKIGDSAFAGCSSLSSIIIPDSITSIGIKAFSNCTSLKSISLTESINVISEQMFSNCTSLKTINLPDSISRIDKNAFYKCSSLRAIFIPSSVQYIGDSSTNIGPFYWCSASMIIYCESETILSGWAENWYYHGDNTYFSIYMGVNRYEADYWISLDNNQKHIIIPSNISFIPVCAFSRNKSLESVYIPLSVTTIKASTETQSPFYLSNVTIFCEAQSKPSGWDGYWNSGAKATFWGKTNGEFEFWGSIDKDQTVINIPEYISFIPDNAFAGFESLIEITIPDSVTSIGNSAFSGCTSLTSITIPDSVTSIGNSAFYGCNSLTNVIIPDSITNIGRNAFRNCFSLNNVILSDGLIIIETGVFSGCSSLTEIIIPDSITIIGDEAFSGCINLVTVDISDSVVSIGKKSFLDCSSLKTILLPNSLTSIGEQAYYGCSSLKNIFIPSSVTTINARTYEVSPFYGCDSPIIYCEHQTTPSGWGSYWVVGEKTIEWGYTREEAIYWIDLDKDQGDITIPDYIHSIPRNAFLNCNSLKTISLPDGLVSIEEKAFSGCSSLRYLFIPSSVVTINASGEILSPFFECSYDLVIYCETQGKPSGWDMYWYYYGNDFFSRITVIWGASRDEAEYWENLDTSNGSIIIPDYVTFIPKQGFYKCSSMMGLYIPSSVQRIYCSSSSNVGPLSCFKYILCESPGRLAGWETFWNSHGNVIIPTFWSVDKNVASFWLNLDKSQKEITVEEGFSFIPPYAFYGMTSLESIELPNSINSIGEYAFYGCRNLISVDLPDGITSIQPYTFYKCSSLSIIEIPDQVKSIGQYAFYDCTSLMSVFIPKSVVSISGSPFYECLSSTVVYCETEKKPSGWSDSWDSTWPNDNKVVSYFDVSKDVFYFWSSFDELQEEVVIPDSITFIPAYAFAYKDLDNLKRIVISDSVKSIGEYAFYNCSSITEMIIPDSITDIGESAFSYCNSLQKVKCPATLMERVLTSSKDSIMTLELTGYLEEIDYSTFSGFTHLTHLILPNGLKRIGDNSFYNKTSLREVSIPNSVTDIGDRAFGYCRALTSIVIPNSVKNIGKEVFYSCSDLTEVILSESITEIPDYLFKDCESLQTIAIPTGVKRIGNWAFSGCNGLIDVSIPDSITEIESYAFWDCSSLKKLIIPSSVLTIGNGAFAGCNGLIDVSIPDSITEIESYAFWDCSSLKKLIIPSSVLIIGNGAFAGCTAINELSIPDSLKEIPQTAFSECSSVEIARIPFTCLWIINKSDKSLKEIELIGEPQAFSFYGFTVLETITIPNSVIKIESCAFDQCGSLNTIIGFENVQYIGSNAFRGTQIESFPFGNNMYFVSGSSFLENSNYDAKYPSYLYHELDVDGDGIVDYHKYKRISFKKHKYVIMSGEKTILDFISDPVVNNPDDLIWYSLNEHIAVTASGEIIIPPDIIGFNTHVQVSTIDGVGSDMCEVYYIGDGEFPYDYFKPDITSLKILADGVELSFMSDDYNSFRVLRKESKNDQWDVIAEITGGDTIQFSYKDENVKPGVTYYYAIKGYNLDLENRSVTWSISETVSVTVNPFKDVKDNASYFKHLMWAYNNGVIAGTSDTTFSPNSDCKRCDLAVMLYRMYGKPSISGLSIPFTDVKTSDYFYKAVVWAYNKGYIKGTSATKFNPKGTITRQDMVVILWRINGSKKVNIANPFTDVDESSYAYKAIMWAYANKITSGTSATTFAPKANCLRYQLAVFLHKFNDIQHVIA